MVNYDIKNIYQWPLGARILVIALISILLFLLCYVVDIVSFKSQIANSVIQENDLKEQLQLMLQKQITVKGNVAQLPAIKALLQEWQNKIASKNEMPVLLEEIMKAGQANQLKITSFNPANETRDGIYFKTPVSIDMSGTYDQIATFISQLANMSKLVNIDAFTLKKNADKQSAGNSGPLNSNDLLTAQLDIEIYRK